MGSGKLRIIIPCWTMFVSSCSASFLCHTKTKCAAVNGVLTTSLRSVSFLEDDSVSLSDKLSSPERYANSLNMTIKDVARMKQIHMQASEDLHVLLQSKELTGVEKHSLMCQHRHKYGRHPFVCQKCWSYLPVCICSLVGAANDHDNKNQQQRQQKIALPKGLEVVVWTHHREWGLTSNTGCILGLTLENCTLLMKGLPEHDKYLEKNILTNDNCLPIVLWPEHRRESNNIDNNENITNRKKIKSNCLSKPVPVSDSTTKKTVISLEEVKKEMKNIINNNKCGRIVLIAVDGTWRNARRMVRHLPTTVPRLDLSSDAVHAWHTQEQFNNKKHNDKNRQSILAPLRKQGPSGEGKNDQRKVCTAEAVVGALIHLGLDKNDGGNVLNITRKKVDLIKRYRGMV